MRYEVWLDHERIAVVEASNEMMAANEAVSARTGMLIAESITEGVNKVTLIKGRRARKATVRVERVVEP